MGRKSLIHNKLIRDTILDHIRKGNYIKTACMAAGIDERTLQYWQQRAERYSNSNGDRVEEDDVYFRFFLELKTAAEQNIAHNVAVIQKATESNHPNAWYPAAWLLERKRPAEYGKRLELEVGPSKVLLALREQARESLGITDVPQRKVIDTVVTESIDTTGSGDD